ncbi:MAG: YraN family protein [Oscillospiraceae bacterium]|nr:YraN family protein [Oscillospiraceae bacterium]
MDRRNGIGAWGEDLAAKFLKKQGYRILERNFSCRFGEIDIIVADRNYLVFVEVKLRKSDAIARAADFVDFRKQNRLRTTAELWLSQHETELQPRFDVVEIYAPEGERTKKPLINHLEDAFQ